MKELRDALEMFGYSKWAEPPIESRLIAIHALITAIAQSLSREAADDDTTE